MRAPRPPARIVTPTGALNAWWAVLMVVVAAGLTAAACIVFTIHTQHVADDRGRQQQVDMERRFHQAQLASERQSCGLLNILDKPLPAGAPARSVAILREIHAWRVRAGC